MEAYEYQTLFDFETSYWWYHALHRVILDNLRALNLPVNARILDAGCGTGGNLANIQAQPSYHAFGFDFSPHASPFWGVRGLDRLCRASINEIPFADGVFDVVMSIDVLESDAVDETHACAEMWRVTKPGGYLMLVVPAYDWLLTEEHHRAVHASRRYSRRKVAALLVRQNSKIVRSTHVFALLFPAIALYRTILQRRAPTSDAPKSELKPLPPPVNSLLKTVMSLERHALRLTNMPFGSSILTIARKDAA